MELTLERLYDQYETMINENYSQKDLNWVIDLISEMESGIFEDTGSVGSTGVALANATTA